MSIDGKWYVEATFPTGPAQFQLELKSSGSELSGKMSGLGGGPSMDLENGKIEADQITWEVNIRQASMKIEFAATLSGETFEGTANLGTYGEGKLVGSRSPMAVTPRERAYHDTLPPEAISDELAPVIAELGLEKNCRELAEEGWTVVENAATPEFNDRLRQKILELTGAASDTERGGAGNMMLAKDPLFAEAVLNPKLMAMAEFSVGRGFLLSQVAASVRPKGSDSIGLHADHNWVPAPFPAHNLLVTGCWVCDDYSKAGGSTLVVPGSNKLARHPDPKETEEKRDAIAIECPAGSVAMWGGNIWHANWPRTTDGQRVVCHITYSRLMMRTVEDYRAHADDLVAKHGEKMAQLMGQEDFLEGAKGADYSKLTQTFNNPKR